MACNALAPRGDGDLGEDGDVVATSSNRKG